jgi:hypothetical protein
MPEQIPREQWVDGYVRGRLSADDIEAFETELLESPGLQEELETALALRAALAQEQDSEGQPGNPPRPFVPNAESANWQPVALAASITLAVVSTVMWWKMSNDTGQLEQQVQALSQPVAEILTVQVPIMRASGSQSPDVIVLKPEGRAAVLLDIELGLQAREEAQLGFALVDSEGSAILAWRSAPLAGGHATAVIPSEQIPASQLWLEISGSDGETLERRLLEFRSRD